MLVFLMTTQQRRQRMLLQSTSSTALQLSSLPNTNSNVQGKESGEGGTDNGASVAVIVLCTVLGMAACIACICVCRLFYSRRRTQQQQQQQQQQQHTGAVGRLDDDGGGDSLPTFTDTFSTTHLVPGASASASAAAVAARREQQSISRMPIHQSCVLFYDWFDKESEHDGSRVQQQHDGAAMSPAAVAVPRPAAAAAAAPSPPLLSPPLLSPPKWPFSPTLAPQHRRQQPQVATTAGSSARSSIIRARWAMAYPAVSITVDCTDEDSARSSQQQQQLQ
ncbi:hypothetical protein Vretimale_17353 [Volvox reticuliferus]|uniref:Uncharacterized protein n=1 Tax=Volvox reticuliferus TaxID=1737510 RepID=A0A8J4GW14_9CHLO|nr:hypothetical protein Vretimale_17353 [Volvox reticuliferus]